MTIALFLFRIAEFALGNCRAARAVCRLRENAPVKTRKLSADIKKEVKAGGKLLFIKEKQAAMPKTPSEKRALLLCRAFTLKIALFFLPLPSFVRGQDGGKSQQAQQREQRVEPASHFQEFIGVPRDAAFNRQLFDIEHV